MTFHIPPRPIVGGLAFIRRPGEIRVAIVRRATSRTAMLQLALLVPAPGSPAAGCRAERVTLHADPHGEVLVARKRRRGWRVAWHVVDELPPPPVDYRPFQVTMRTAPGLVGALL